MSAKPKSKPSSKQKNVVRAKTLPNSDKTETSEESMIRVGLRREGKNRTLNLRVNARCLEVIDKAVELQPNSDRTKYILDAAYKAAENDLYKRVNFFLSKEEFCDLEKILNAKPRNLPKLKALLNEKAPWKK